MWPECLSEIWLTQAVNVLFSEKVFLVIPLTAYNVHYMPQRNIRLNALTD